MYGPTECTVASTSFDNSYERHQLTSQSACPIGRQFFNNQLHISYPPDNFLWISGYQVSNGYIGRDEITKERFVYDVYLNDGIRKMYNSGDKARYLEDGNVMYEGRGDDQVKISGQRVELGAVEGAMMGVEGVIGSVCVVEEVGESKRLVGVVGWGKKKKEEGKEKEKKEFIRRIMEELRKKVAKHEIPHRIMVIEEIPLSVAGKADRKKIKEIIKEIEIIGNDNIIIEKGKVNIGVEERVEKIFSEILGKKIEKGRESNFLEEGGTSLMMMKLVGRVEEEFGVRMEMRRLMRDSSIGRVVEEIREGKGKGEDIEIEIEKEKESDKRKEESTIYCRTTEGQAGLYFIWKMDKEATDYTVPMVMVNEKEEGERWEVVRMRRVIEMMVEVHSALRTIRFQMMGNGIVVQEIDWKIEIDYEEWKEEDKVMKKAKEEMEKGWDLEGEEKLMRVRIGKRIVLILFHHIIMDEWSGEVMREQMNELYYGKLKMKELGVEGQYYEFCEWEGRILEKEGKELGEWWSKNVKGLKEEEIIEEGKRGIEKSYGMRIPKEIRKEMERKSKEEGVTIFSIYQMMYGMWKGKMKGNKKESIVGPYGRRGEGKKYSKSVGYFLNMLIYVYEVEKMEKMNIEERIVEGGRVVMEAMEHGMYPFQRIVRENGIDGGRMIEESMFAWVSKARRGRSEELGIEHMAKGKWNVSCDGEWIIGSYDNKKMEEREGEERIESFIKYMKQELKGEKIRRVVYRNEQEEEWNMTYKEVEGKKLSEVVGKGLRSGGVSIVSDDGKIEMRGVRLEEGVYCIGRRMREIGEEGSSVGIWMDRSVMQVVGTYGIVMGGRSFLPLDGDYSREVVEYRMRDGGSEGMIIGIGKEGIEGMKKINISYIERNRNIKENREGSDIAYVYYTSGSTGKPKGIRVRNENVCNLLDWHNLQYMLSERDCMLYLSSPSFDSFIVCLFA